MIDEQVQFAHALRDRYETKTFIAERGPARDLGQGLGSKRALDTLGKAEPSFDRIEQANSTRCQTPERALRVVDGSNCRPHRIEARSANSHHPVIHGPCRAPRRHISRVSARAQRCRWGESEISIASCREESGP